MPRPSTAEQKAEFIARQRSYDPPITSENYFSDLIRYQTYHNVHTDYKNLRKRALDYAKGVTKNIDALDRASDFELRTIGIIGYAIKTGKPILQKHIDSVNKEILDLVAKYSKRKPAISKQKEVVTKVEDKITPLVSKHVAEVNAAIDDYVTQGKEFSMKAYLATENVNSAVAKLIPEHFKKLEQELREAVAGKDDQLREGYSFMGKVKLKRFYALVQQIISDCAQQVVTAKIRKPRVHKEKPPAVLAAKMKYQKAEETLKLTSEKPETIIGSDTVWVYDTARRKLSGYVADSGQKLSIRGTTVTGFSVKESMVKTIRKPDIMFSGNLAKRVLLQNFKDLKTKSSVPNGRTNETSIIVKVFK